jgi:hypothetical protein
MIEVTINPAGLKSPLPRRLLRSLLPIAMSIALTVLLGSADAWAKGNALQAGAGEPAAQSTATEFVTGQSESTRLGTDGSYAQREAAAAGLETFKGGDVVIISSATVIIVLLVILILVLI